MKPSTFMAVALAMSLSAFAQASPPPAPTLTAGADFKGLQFDWDPVAGATWYQLELFSNRTGTYVQQGGNYSASATSARITFALHLFDWPYARYRLAACNSTGCSHSADVSV